jgi:hypothetical protein
MTHLRLSLPALALVVAGTWANQALACDKDKATATTATTAAHASCSAEMAAACTPEMAAACKAKGATKASAVTAAMTSSKAASMDCCASKSAKTAVASRSTAKAGKSTMVVASSGACTGMMDAALTVADGHGSCASTGKATAVVAGSGGQCSSKSSATATRMGHGECDACADMVMCSGELETAGTRTQIVPLKNGVMFVYTAEEPGNVNAVQSAMARRSSRLSQIVTAGDRARLCGECKEMRGAIASGKMTREVINIEGGALTLMTSTDPLMVKKIRAMVDGNKIARAKS